MKVKDYYQTLGVSRSAGGDEIKRAYRRLVRKYHPDVSTEPDADAQFKRMKAAYEVLKDPARRAAYDASNGTTRSERFAETPPYWESMFSFSATGFSGASAFGDIFDTFFDHGERVRDNGRFSSNYHDSEFDSDDVSASIAISLEDAYQGATRRMTLELTEQDRYGYTFRKRRTVDVTIPKGITSGQRIRLEYQESADGRRRSRTEIIDLIVEFEPHPVFEVSGKDVHVILPVTPWETVLGRTVKIPTLAGPVDLRIPMGARNGQRLRLRGKGLPGLPAGDQIVELALVLPPTTSSRARKLYEELENMHSFNPRADLGV